MISMPNKLYSICNGKILLSFEYNGKVSNAITKVGDRIIISYYSNDSIRQASGKVNGVNIGNDTISFVVGDKTIGLDSIVAMNITEKIDDIEETVDITPPGDKFITSLKELSLSDMDNLYEALNADDAFKEIGTKLQSLQSTVGGAEIDDVNLSSTTTTLSAYQTILQINNIITKVTGMAPDLMDTFEEVANALNDDPNFSATILNLLSNKVDKVEGKGLSTNDYISEDKLKVGKIITTGDGASYLANDGTYKSIEPAGNTGAGIDDTNLSSTTTTLSASKIVLEISAKIAEKVEAAPELLDTFYELANALNNDPSFATTIINSLSTKVDKVAGKGLSTNDYTDTDKTKVGKIITTGDGASYLANDGNYKLFDDMGTSIDDVVPSTTSTYSSTKIEQELQALETAMNPSSIINNTTASTTSTYSSSKIEQELQALETAMNPSSVINDVAASASSTYSSTKIEQELQALETAMDPSSVINDAAQSTTSTYSSTKIKQELQALETAMDPSSVINDVTPSATSTYSSSKIDGIVGELDLSSVINDTTPSTTSTYSSTKIDQKISDLGTPVYADPMDVKDEHIVEHGFFQTSTTQTTGLTAGSLVFIDSKVSGNMPIDATKHTIALTPGKSYKIIYGVTGYLSSTTASSEFVLRNNIDGALFGPKLSLMPMNLADKYSTIATASFEYEATSNCDLCMDIKLANITAIYNAFIDIMEIAQPVVTQYNKEVSNPLTTKPLENGEFGISANKALAANTSLILDTIYNGNMNIVNGGIHLTAGVTYEFGVNIVYLITNGAGSTINLRNIDTNTNVKILYEMLPLSISTSYGSNFSSVTFTPDVDMNVTISVTNALTSIAGITFKIIVKEYRGVSVNQYGGFDTKVLFSGVANAVANYTLVDSIENYNFLLIESSIDGDNALTITSIISPIGVVYNKSRFYRISRGYYSATEVFVDFGFINNLTLTIGFLSGPTLPKITKILGIKGQLPTLLSGGVF